MKLYRPLCSQAVASVSVSHSSPIGQPRAANKCSWSHPNPSSGGGVHSKATWSPATAAIWLFHNQATNSDSAARPMKECFPGAFRMHISWCRSDFSVDWYQASQPVLKIRMSPGLMVVFWNSSTERTSDKAIARPEFGSTVSPCCAAQAWKLINTPRPTMLPRSSQSVV